MRRQARVVAALFLALSTLIASGGCVGGSKALEPPAQAIQSLLELRAERSTDASAYAEFLSEPEVAVELARIAAEETPGVEPIPDWDTPYVSAESSSAADVVVVWRAASEDWPDWPVATIFKMQLVDDRWVARDAETVEGTAPPPPR